MKAFLVNRVGDFGFILGIGLIAAYAHTLNYARGVRRLHEGRRPGGDDLRLGTDWLLITVTCICLFIGAMGKSRAVPAARVAARLDGRPDARSPR